MGEVTVTKPLRVTVTRNTCSTNGTRNTEHVIRVAGHLVGRTSLHVIRVAGCTQWVAGYKTSLHVTRVALDLYVYCLPSYCTVRCHFTTSELLRLAHRLPGSSHLFFFKHAGCAVPKASKSTVQLKHHRWLLCLFHQWSASFGKTTAKPAGCSVSNLERKVLYRYSARVAPSVHFTSTVVAFQYCCHFIIIRRLAYRLLEFGCACCLIVYYFLFRYYCIWLWSDLSALCRYCCPDSLHAIFRCGSYNHYFPITTDLFDDCFI